MRKLIAAFTLAFGVTTASSAHAIPYGYGEDLRFVAQTDIPGPQGTLALCHLVSYADAVFVPLYTNLKGYALSGDRCDGEMYRGITQDEFIALQTSGMIPADLPTTPSVDLKSLIWGHAWLFVIGIVLVFKGLMIIRHGSGRPRKAAAPDALAIHSLVAMSQVAVADGHIDESEVRQISVILTRLTGQSYSMEQVTELLARLNPSEADLEQVGRDLSARDRQIILEAALNIAVADGDIHPSEYAIVSDLAQRMQIGADEFRHAMTRISQHLSAVHPA